MHRPLTKTIIFMALALATPSAGRAEGGHDRLWALAASTGVSGAHISYAAFLMPTGGYLLREDLSGAFATGLAVKRRLGRGLTLGLEWGLLDPLAGTDSYGNIVTSSGFTLMSTALGLAWGRRLSGAASALEPWAGLSLGYDRLMGAKAAYSHLNAGMDYEHAYDGSVLSSKVLLGADLFINESFSLGLELGWRFAKISDTRVTVVKESSSPSGPDLLDVDYSGYHFRLGLAFWL